MDKHSNMEQIPMNTSESIDQLLATASQHIQANRLRDAELIYRRVLEREPHQPKALHLLGAVRLELGDASGAIDLVGRSLAIAPENAFAYYHLGLAHVALDNLDQAVQSYQRCIELQPDFAETHNNLGLVLQRQGRLEQAMASYRRALEVRHEYPKAYNNLGTVLMAQGALTDAIAAYQAALQIEPGYLDALGNLGNAWLMSERPDEAVGVFTEAAGRDVGNPGRQTDLGRALLAAGRPQDARVAYEKALELGPGVAETHSGLGDVLMAQGRFEAAAVAYGDALALDPDHVETHNNLSVALREQERFEEAIEVLGRALAVAPDDPMSHHNLGSVLLAQGRIGASLNALETALELNPRAVDTCNNLSVALRALNRLDQAAAILDTALSLMPAHANTYNNLGSVRFAQERIPEAIVAYRRAIELNPSSHEAYVNLGVSLKEQGDLDGASSALDSALKRRPGDEGATAFLFEIAQLTCDWERARSLLPTLSAQTVRQLDAGKMTAETPLNNLRRSADPSLNLAVARSWSRELVRRTRERGPDARFDHERSRPPPKLRVGYLSSDFGGHPVGRLIAGLFGLHNRNAFDVHAYATSGDDGSDFRARIRRDCDQLADITHLSHVDAAKLIYDDRVHILVDLNGYTKNNRMEICAMRPAPIQVSYLGFPGSTGADFIDYVITDRVLTPEDQASCYSERFVYMPQCYQVNDRMQRIAETVYSRADFDLPEGAIVFCCFNHTYKIEPVIFDAWMRILRQVGGSVLWLLDKYPRAVNNLKQEASARGVDPKRLVFSEPLPLEQHLSRLALADLALDTCSYNGGATTSNCLWAGLPVLTLVGHHYVSRMSASLLNAVRLPELVASSLESYEAQAVRLARDPRALTAMRQRLWDNRLTGSLFDTQDFARKLESAYAAMWARVEAGLPPTLIEVPEAVDA